MQRCLIIDGSPIVRKVTRAILADFGFDVMETSSGREGMSLFQRNIPRLALVDAALTDMPALDVLRSMRDIAGGRVQILYCPTQFDVLELQHAHAAGASDVLVKPFDRHSLAAKLDAWPRDGEPSARENFFNRLSRSELVRVG